MVKEGDKAPSFILKDADGKLVRLADLKGKKLVLYFYPKDNTPGCTKEACSFRDDFSKFRGKNIEIFGVSLDDEKSHQRFAEKFGLPFRLLSDADAEVSKRYGVYKLKNFMGREFWGIVRTTFLIGEDGRIIKIFPQVNVESHSGEVLKAFA